MFEEDDGLEAAAQEGVPVFPLPNAVLLPGMVLPLNVFEPRYLELVDYAREHGNYIGVPLLCPGYEDTYEGRPAIESIFGVGKIISHKALPDGRRFIRLAGTRRVRMQAELPPDETFRRVRGQVLPEDTPQDRTQLEVLEAQLERIAATLHADDAELVQSVLDIADARVRLYATAAIVPTLGIVPGTASDQRSRLLQMQQQTLDADSADARLNALVAFAAELGEELRDAGRLPKTLLN